jgi:hypothetical protein
VSPPRDAPSAQPILAVFDDTIAGAMVLEWSAALARALQRELAVVYVESTPALLAAALPFARVLGPQATQWAPLAPGDVELGFRAQAARLRALTERITVRHAVGWSMRVVRGALPGVALELLAESDLMFLGTLPPTHHAAAGERPGDKARGAVIAVVADDSALGERALAVATELARSLSGRVQITPVQQLLDEVEQTRRALLGARADMLVVPQGLLAPALIARLPCPALLVAGTAGTATLPR